MKNINRMAAALEAFLFIKGHPVLLKEMLQQTNQRRPTFLLLLFSSYIISIYLLYIYCFIVYILSSSTHTMHL